MNKKWEFKKIEDPKKPPVVLAVLTLENDVVAVENMTDRDVAGEFAAGISAANEKMFYPKDGEKFIQALKETREFGVLYTLPPVE